MSRIGLTYGSVKLAYPAQAIRERTAVQIRSMTTTISEQGPNSTPDHLNSPYGGELVNIIAGPHRASDLQMQSCEWRSWDLTPRQLCDLELLLNGGFSPLRGFMVRADYESTCARMPLCEGENLAIPDI